MSVKDQTRQERQQIVLEGATANFLKEINSQTGLPLSKRQVDDIRAGHAAMQNVPVRRLPVDVEDHRIATPLTGNVLLKIVRPHGRQGILPSVIYLHGGGWVQGDWQDFDRLVSDLAYASDAAIVYVEYSRSPEAPYPVAVEEAYAAARWIQEHGNRIGIDPARVAIAGDSAGGNMAAAVALLTKQRGGPRLAFQALFYPNTDASFDSESYTEFRRGYFLSREDMLWFTDQYLPQEARREEATATPLNATLDQLAGLPPALIITAEYDVLRDEGEAFARKLMEAGVPVTGTRYLGTIHAFVTLNKLAGTAPARAAIAQAGAALRSALVTPTTEAT